MLPAITNRFRRVQAKGRIALRHQVPGLQIARERGASSALTEGPADASDHGKKEIEQPVSLSQSQGFAGQARARHQGWNDGKT